MHTLILVVTLLSTAFAVPLYVQNIEEAILIANHLHGDDIALRDSLFESIIRGIIEDFRETMVTGSDDIPVLDPFQLDYLNVDDQTLPFPGAQLTIKDLIVNQLSTFEINELRVTLTSIILQRYNVEVDLTVPELDIEVGNYNLLLNAMGYNVFGNGRANIKVIRPRAKAIISANLRPSISAGITVNLNDLRIEFGLGAFEPQITGLFNDDAVSSFVSTVLNFLVPDLVDKYEDEINDFLSEIVFDIVSDLLR